MPRYDYRCTSPECAERFEVTQSFHDDPVAECPVCGNSARRLISSVAVHFKGSGFYVTDNRASNGAGAGTGSSDRDGSAESKPAAAKKDDSKSGESKAASKAGSGSSNSSKK